MSPQEAEKDRTINQGLSSNKGFYHQTLDDFMADDWQERKFTYFHILVSFCQEKILLTTCL